LSFSLYSCIQMCMDMCIPHVSGLFSFVLAPFLGRHFSCRSKRMVGSFILTSQQFQSKFQNWVPSWCFCHVSWIDACGQACVTCHLSGTGGQVKPT
jgi:hypothetical protein